MKKFTILLASIATAAAAVPAVASAAPLPGYGMESGRSGGWQPRQQGAWQNINARQNRIEAKINQGMRSGALTQREAMQLRGQFHSIATLEARYRASRPGLTIAERLDLDRRFDALDRSIRVQKNDRDNRGHGRRY